MTAVIVGPVLAHRNAYAFSTWTPEFGLSPGYRYRCIEDAYYARKAEFERERPATGLVPVICATLDVFHAEIAATASSQ